MVETSLTSAFHTTSQHRHIQDITSRSQDNKVDIASLPTKARTTTFGRVKYRDKPTAIVNDRPDSRCAWQRLAITGEEHCAQEVGQWVTCAQTREAVFRGRESGLAFRTRQH